MFDLSNISFGKNLVWFFGVVENRMDPNFLGRVQVRCFGHHSPNRFEIPTEDLPWAMVMQPTTSAAQTDVGQSPTGLVEGSWVVGFFMDGDEAQQPLVIGSVGGYANRPEKLTPEDADDWAEYGFKDVREEHHLEGRGFPSPPLSVDKKPKTELGVDISEERFVERYPREESSGMSTVPKLARGVKDHNIYLNEENSRTSTNERTTKVLKEPMLSKYNNENSYVQTARHGVSFSQPTVPYNAVYPFNHVKETESGHVIEFDDTPGAERIHEYHRSGTFREIHPDGKLVAQNMNEKYDFTESNSYEYTKGEKIETYRKGLSTLVNAGRFGGEDYELRVCGSSNYNLTVEEGNVKIKTTTGQIKLVTNSLVLESPNEIVQATPGLLRTRSGDHLHEVEDVYQSKAGGTYSIDGGYVSVVSTMNTSLGAGDTLTMTAAHGVLLRGENTFLMPPFYFPVPRAVRIEAGVGHIELRAEDGDTRISSRLPFTPKDLATFSVTSPDPTSIATTFQLQPSPHGEPHAFFPGSIIGQTHTGYIYFESLNGDIVSHALGLNSVRMRSTPKGMIEQTGGAIIHTATSTNILNAAAMNFIATAKQSVMTFSGLGTHITSKQAITLHSGVGGNPSAPVIVTSAGPTMIGSINAAVHLGTHGAHEPTLKGPSFLKTFFAHTHLTPMGPTTPVDFISNPQLALWAAQSLAKKTMVF